MWESLSMSAPSRRVEGAGELQQVGPLFGVFLVGGSDSGPHQVTLANGGAEQRKISTVRGYHPVSRQPTGYHGHQASSYSACLRCALATPS